MNLKLLTLSPGSLLYKFKKFSQYLENFRSPGPRAVIRSLKDGLDELGIEYDINPRVKDISGTIGVLRGVRTLRWAIKAKREGKVKKIIAGPNIVVTPEDAGGILLDETIDLIIKPSQWVKDFYSSFKPGFDRKIRVWPAGVENPKDFQEKPRKGCLIYKKNVEENLFNFIIKHLKSQSIDYKIIKYGRYKKEKYFEMLNKVKFMIYLQETESEGIALLEAWMRNVPTLVWDRGYWQYGKYKWQGSSSAPYLIEECGIFFKDEKDFVNKFQNFINNLSNFKPREYSLENFIDKITSNRYLEFVKEISHP